MENVTGLDRRVGVLEQGHGVLAENVRMNQATVNARLRNHDEEIKALRGAQFKLTVWLALLASGGSAVGSAIVNALSQHP